MRITGCIIAAIVTIVLIYFLDNQQNLNGSKTPAWDFSYLRKQVSGKMQNLPMNTLTVILNFRS
jgi:hypothetical protein